METRTAKTDRDVGFVTGTGLCPEAQADGVPCTALGRDCEICERAYPKERKEEPAE